MPAKRFFMRQVRAVLRRQWACGLRDRQSARRLRRSRPPVAQSLQRATVARRSWPLPAA